MKINALGIIIFLLLLLLIIGFYLVNKESSGLKEKKIVYINDNKFYVEIAKSPLEKARGLSGRKSLPKNEGVLFVYQSPSRPKFWMRGMFFPIDIIWIRNGKIVKISKNISVENLPFPKTIDPGEKIDMVLEINAKVSDKLNINPGDKVAIKNS